MEGQKSLLPFLIITVFTISLSCEDYDDGSDNSWEDGFINERGTLPDDIYQAEDHTATSGCREGSNHTGFTGSGFMDYGGNGSWTEWNNVTVSKAGDYKLTFRYAVGSAARRSAVIVNGENQGNVSFSGTGSWTNWKRDSTTVSLRPGKNTIRVLANTQNGGPNLDRIQVSSADDNDSSFIKCATASEHGKARLTCGSGQTIVDIVFASYGTPGGTCSSGYKTSSCHAASSNSKVKSSCLGRNSCAMRADNTVFGDPCKGKTKRLYVEYTCSSGDGDDESGDGDDDSGDGNDDSGDDDDGSGDETPTEDFQNGWQIVNTGYETDDTVVVAMVMTEDNLPSDPAKQNCSTAFNNAFRAVSNKGGGVVYAPAGEYLFTRPLELPHNVVLRGAWGSVRGSDKSVRGTILKVKYNGLYTRNDPAFIQLNSRSGLRDLTIWYPDQDLDDVTPYTRTIDGATDKPDELLIENVNLVNSYVGLDIQGNAKRPFCRGVYGSPLKMGMYQERSSSVPTYTQVYFSAEYWAKSGLPGAPSESALRSYLKKNATGIKVGGSDNIFASEWHVEGYRIGLHFIKNDGGNINGNMYGLYITNCREALRADSIGPSFIINSVFESSDTAVSVKGLDSVIGVLFNNCTFKSSSGNAFECTHTDAARSIQFQNCEFNKPITAGSSELTVVDSKFNYSSGKPIQLNSKTKLALLAGNSFTYSGDPVQLNGASSSRVILSKQNTHSETYEPFDVSGYNSKRKPYQQNLITMGKTNGYRVHVDGSTDDSATIQKALNKVHSMGGGIVLLPQISEKGYGIRGTINVPEGVELRGTSEGLHSFNGPREDVPSALLQIYHGRGGRGPTITLNKGSGFRGLTVHYPQQRMNSIAAYAPTVKIAGDGAYVINNQFLNSYIHIVMNGCEDVLVESNLMSHIYRNFVLNNCKNVRFSHNFVRGEWDDSGLNTVGSVSAYENFGEKHNIAYEIANSRNIEIFASFSRCSKNLAVVRNSTMHTLQFSMEGCLNAIKIDGIPQGMSVELIGSSLRTDHGGNSADSMFDIETGSSDGDFRVFSALCTGYPATFLEATDADMIFQNSFVRLDEKDTSIRLRGSGSGVMRMENCTIIRHSTDLSIQNSSGKRMEVVGCHFDSGMNYSSNSGQVNNTLNPANLSGSTRLAHTATRGLDLN